MAAVTGTGGSGSAGRAVLRLLWPAPRRPVSWRAWLPLLAFVVLLPLACLWAERSDLLTFSRVWPFLLLGAAPWIWRQQLAGYSGLSRGRATIALWNRFALLALLLLALCEPRQVRSDERLTLIYAIDHSASISPQTTDRALSYVLSTMQGIPERDEAGLIFFGRNAAVELPPATALPFEAINVEIDRDGTDLARSLALAAALVPPDRPGRIVLISDGAGNLGSLSATLDDLAARDIAVDIWPVDYRFEHEVWLERLDMPRQVKIGQSFEAAVVLSSLQAGTGRLRLEQNGKVIATEAISFAPGKSRFSLPVTLHHAGYYEYRAHVSVDDDRDSWKRNNEALSFVYLHGKGKVLLVSSAGGDERAWQGLHRALAAGERDVERIDPYAFPRDRLALEPYDCVLFVDVPRETFDEIQLKTLHDAVFDQGVGFVMIGGPNSFGPGGYHRTPVEDVLPVSMDIKKRKMMPMGALAIILHTCEFADGNTWGKRITKQAMRVLDPKDEVGVLVYDVMGQEKWLFGLAPAAEYDRLAVLVNEAQIGDMPSFASTMQMGLDGLKASAAATRHMIIISDGDPAVPPPSLLAAFKAAQVSVSTIAINPHSPADLQPMQMIAQVTGGKFYHPQDPGQLPRIFIKEAKTLRRSAVQETTFTPEVVGASPILKGLSALPPLHGLVWVSPKARSQTLLEGPAEEEADPVLATWRYGVGATAAFTSDLSSRWGRDWVAWPQYSAFVRQLITEVSRAEQQKTIQVHCFSAGGEGHIVVESFDPKATFLTFAAKVEAPRGAGLTLPLRQIGPARYETRFPLQGTGRYHVTVAGEAFGTTGGPVRAHGGFVVPFSDEYLRFRADPLTMERIRERSGGRRLTGREAGAELFTPDRRARLSSQPILDLLLAAFLVLLVLDVGFRRVHIDLQVLKNLFRRRGAETAATLGSLLAVKERRAREAAERREVAPPEAGQAPVAPRSGPRGIERQPETGAAPTGDPAGASATTTTTTTTTTSRLLAAKRRAQGKEQGEEG